MFTPTLLIGLGGIGSEIVDRVYGLIPENERSRIAVHAFDTDVNDLTGNLKSLGDENSTQTSTRLTVGQYLDKTDETVKAWFPHNIKALRRKTLTDGAGQIRVISRLAYRAAMAGGKLDKLENQITNLFRATDDDKEHSIRVMIVSSLAGGTGSGIFLQTALYLRELLQRNYGSENILIRGAFMLPDVMARCKVIKSKQSHNIRFNGYAAVKELDAITQAANSVDDARNITIELEYRPDQVSVSRRKDHSITEKHLPYNFVFLYDHERSDGQNIGTTFDNYKSQMVKSIFLQLFSPIAAKNFSLEDNLIREYVESEGRSFYGGAGVSSLVYPYKDMVEYLSLKWVLSSLDGNWLRLDKEYEQVKQEFRANPEAYYNQAPPTRSDLYVKGLDRLGRDHDAELFFKSAYKSLFIYDDMGQVVQAKSDRFLEQVYDFIDINLAQEAAIENLVKKSRVDEDNLSRQSAVEIVTRTEMNLNALEGQISELTVQLASYVHSQVMVIPCNQPTSALSGYQLNRYTLGKDDEEVLHPVAVRSFLYQVKALLDVELAKEGEEANAKFKSINRYKESFNDKDSPGLDTAVTRMKEAVGMNRLKGMFSDKGYKSFASDYITKSRKQLRRLVKYKLSRTRELVLTRLINDIDYLIQSYESYFQDLDQVYNNLLSRLVLLGKEHEGKVDTTVRYVLGSRSFKDKLWEEIETHVAGDETPSDISREMYQDIYSRYCEGSISRNVMRQGETTESMFKSSVLEWCKAKISGLASVDMDVVTALDKEMLYIAAESGRTGQDRDAMLKDYMRKLGVHSKPFVPTEEGGSTIRYWGMHSDAISQIPDYLLSEMFGSDLITRNTESFSRYEILCYSAAYGLKATDLKKFTVSVDGTEGKYFEAYNTLVSKLNTKASVVTPHLDKRWHLPYYLPDINPHVEQQDSQRIAQAFLLGLIQGFFYPGSEHGGQVWIFTGTTASENVKIGSDNIPVMMDKLYDAMSHNPHIVDQVHEMHQEMLRRDRSEYMFTFSDADPKVNMEKFMEHSFYKGCTKPKAGLEFGDGNIIEIITSLPDSNPGNGKLIEDSNYLLRMFLELSKEYLQTCYGTHRGNLSDIQHGMFVNELLAGSSSYEASLNTTAGSNWRRLIETAVPHWQSEK